MQDINHHNYLGGAVTFWSLGATDRTKLAAAWPGTLSQFLPAARTPAAALKAALHAVYGGSRTLIRPLDKDGAFAVVEETADESSLAHSIKLYAQVGEGGEVRLSDYGAESEVGAAYSRALNVLAPVDVTRALVKLCEQFNGTALRESGGVYWLRKGLIDTWREIVQAVEGASCEEGRSSIYLLHVQADADSARAVLDALAHEVQGDVAAIEAQVREGGLGDRALQARADRARSLLAKVAAYEGDWGTRLDALRVQVERAETCAALAALQVGGDDNALQGVA